MTIDAQEVRTRLLDGVNDEQRSAVEAEEPRTLIIAGAGSGKTEVIARRIARWVGCNDVPKDRIVAFTFTERAAEELKFRIRKHIQAITPVTAAQQAIIAAANDIRRREFNTGPRKAPRKPGNTVRCAECDFREFCGMQRAREYRAGARRCRT